MATSIHCFTVPIHNNVAATTARPTATTTTTRTTALTMVAIDTSDIKNGLTVELEGEPYKVLSFSIMKQARGAAKTTIKFKNLMRGTTIENTYRSGEKFETAMIEKNNAQYTYDDDVRFVLLVFLFFGACCTGPDFPWIPFFQDFVWFGWSSL